MRVLLLHNPGAGDREIDADALTSLVADAGHAVTYRSLKDEEWRRALRVQHDLVAVAGGDGAVRKAVLAMREVSDKAPLSILSVGTANNVARTLGMLDDARSIVARWERPESARPFDAGLVEHGDGPRAFIESFGGGTFAELVASGDEVEEGQTLLGNEIDRALLKLRDLLDEARPAHWEVELDGTDASGEYVGVEMMNIRSIGPNVALAPHADPGDGWLDVALIGREACVELRAHVEQRLHGGSGDPPSVALRRARRVVLEPPGNVRLHVDSEPVDPGGAPRLSCRVIAGAAHVVGS